MGREGTRLSCHTIVLAYRNLVGINALPPLGCGTSVEPPTTQPNCALEVDKELLDGGGESPVVGPISNDIATVTFRQEIGPTQTLRTPRLQQDPDVHAVHHYAVRGDSA